MHTHKTAQLIAALAASATLSSPSAAQQIITEDYTIQASDGVLGDFFGASVAINNNIIAIGSPYNESNTDFDIYSGSAYLYDASTGQELQKLIPSNPQNYDSFGSSIAIHNGAVVVGAPAVGAAYLYNASTGFEVGLFDEFESSAFGHAVAIHDGVVAIGAPSNNGFANLYNAFSGELIHELYPSDANVNDQFGYDVAIHNGLVIIGSPGENDETGAIYLFDAYTGTQITKIVPQNAQPGDRFGHSVDIHENTLAVSAIGNSLNAQSAGAVYLYDNSTFALNSVLSPIHTMEDDFFGVSVALSENILVVGALWSNSTGAAYLFDINTGEEYANLMTNDIVWFDNFASAIAIENNTIIAGAPSNSTGGLPESAYVFTAPQAPQAPQAQCNSDLNNDGTLNFFDISTFLAAFSNQETIADFNNDQRWNFFDVSSFLSDFSLGCP